jgi:hypothetical protein
VAAAAYEGGAGAGKGTGQGRRRSWAKFRSSTERGDAKSCATDTCGRCVAGGLEGLGGYSQGEGLLLRKAGEHYASVQTDSVICSYKNEDTERKREREM